MPAARVQCLLAILLVAASAGCRRQPPLHELVIAQDDLIRVERSAVSDGDAHFYTYRFQGKHVNFFIRTDRAGVLRAHFDACYSCFKYKRGYVQENHQVICRACRIGYDLDTPVWDYVGPCVPVTLKSQVDATHVILPVAALRKGARLF